MTVALDSNVVYLKDRLNINTSRMNNYAEKSVDEIIKEEAKQGNQTAVEYKRELFGNADELINGFKLDDPNNKYNVISAMNDEQQQKLLPMLESEDMVLGLNFFTEEKLLKMFNEVPPEDAVNVALGTFSLEQIVMMLPMEQLEKFFYKDEVEKEQVIKQLEKMPPEILIQMIESITGEPADETDSMALIQSIASLPDNQYKETMANIDPNVQMQLVYQMAHDDKRVLELFDNTAYIGMLQRLQKPDIVKSMIGLSDESLRNMMTELPPDLFAIVATQVDTKELAKFLMEDCQNVLEKLGNK